MDVCKSEQAYRKQTTVETPRRPLVPAEKNNVIPTTRHRTREVPSRYKSPSPSTPAAGPRRCPSPTLTRAAPPPNLSPSRPKRSVSADRRRPATPPSPITPSTPMQDSTAADARKAAAGRVPESLWPSTMRSLSVSFQSDSISIPVSKKEKPASNALSERTLRPSSNVTPVGTGGGGPKKPSPERKRSPLKGKNVADQSENSRPGDSLHARLIDQHRWPSRIAGKVLSNSLSRSVDLGDKSARNLITSNSGVGLSSLRRISPSESMIQPLQKSSSEASRLLSHEGSARANSLDDYKLVAASLSDRFAAPATRTQSLPSGGSRPASPSKTSMSLSSIARGLSPSRSRPSTPPPRGVSPSQIRPSTSSSSQPTNPNSVLSFITDFKKTKKGSSFIEDAHQLRLMYNRCLQWRFANARSQRVLYVQKLNAERTLFNVWSTTLGLWDSVIRKRIILRQMKLELKLNSVLNDQMDYLDDWALLERDHMTSLAGAVEDLEASTLRLPVVGGARADIDSLKLAICSAVDVMQAMASSTCSLLPRVESMNSLVSELAVMTARERAMLNECEALLASTDAMQVEEYSLRTHLIQTKKDLGNLSSQFGLSRHLH